MEARVQPPLLKKELVDMFMSALQGLYYDKMVGIISSGFSDLPTIGEIIEASVKSGNIQGASSVWYMQLERTRIRTWADFANAFPKNYKYNLDMAPTRMQLQNLSQKKE